MKDDFNVLGLVHSGTENKEEITPRFHNSRMPHGVALFIVMLGCWPVWRWYVMRIMDGSDEPFGGLALLVAFVFIPWRSMYSEMSYGRLLLLGSCLLAYATSLWYMPPLVRSILAMLAVTVCAAKGPARLGICMLLGLSLPWLASLQFYLGYPLRVLLAMVLVPFLQLVGQPVVREGVTLWFAGDPVIIDAPCSGVQMLWMGLFAAAFKVALSHASYSQTVRQLRWTGICILVANLLRNGVLFYVETKQWPLPPWGHEAVGLCCFALALVAILLPSFQCNPPNFRCRWSRIRLKLEQALGHSILNSKLCQQTLTLVVLIILLLTGLQPLLLANHPNPGNDKTARDTDLDLGLYLPVGNWSPLALVDTDVRWSATFPGKIQLYGDGYRRLIVRTLTTPTRRLHPAEDCFRGMGYSIESRKLCRDDNSTWAQFSSTKLPETYSVRERIMDTNGHSWGDISAWFWYAITHPKSGPWLSIVEITPQQK